MKKEIFYSQYFFWILISFLFLLMFIFKYPTIHFEPIEFGNIKSILHPDYPKGSITYDPHWHYDYIVAYYAKIFGVDIVDPFSGMSKIFWFLEQALTLIALVKLCNFLFKDDRLTLVLVIFIYLALKSGESDQKTMLRPLHLFAIYYFLKEKWLLSAIFTASISYLHIGFAIWWFVPSCFAIGIIFLMKDKQVTIIDITKYFFTAAFLASPILYFYMGAEQNIISSQFTTSFYYGVHNSILLNLLYDPKAITVLLITVGVFTMGYKKWKTTGGSNDYIVPIAFGVLILYIIDFVLVDVMFNGAAIKLQLLRSKLNVELFASLFFAFLIARQLWNRNIVFFLILLILLDPNPFWVFYPAIDRWIAFDVFYVVVIVYEIFEQQISVARAKVNLFVSNKSVLPQFKKTTNWIQHFFQNPVNLAGFFVVLSALFVTMSLSPIKPYVKSVLGIQQKTGMSKRDSLNKDIARFTNEKIQGDDVILVTHFGEVDFEYYTNHKVFINVVKFLKPYTTGSEYDKMLSSNLRIIFENDLNYSIEKLRGGGSWDEMWKNVDEKLMRKWKKEYGITHVVRENELPLDFPIAYENEYYKVYDLRSLGNSQDA